MLSLSPYGFTSDPFPLVPEAAVRHWAGREEIRRELVDIAECVRFSDVGTSEFLILHGEYGAGKSHALRYLATLINEERAGDFRTKAIYVPSIRVDQKVTFLSLYRAVIEQLGMQFIGHLASDIKKRIDVAEAKLKNDLPKEELVALMQQPNGVRLRAFDDLPKEDRSIVHLLDELAKGNRDVEKFLLGENKSIPTAGYPSAIDTDFAATKVLGGLFRAMTIEIAAQDPPCLGAYLFLDEFETIAELKAAETGPLLNALRELVNQVPYNLCLILSFTAETALIEAVVPQALLQRVSRGYVEFPPLKAEEAKEFLAKHFAAYRPAGYVAKHKFYPFEDATIEMVLEQITEMTPRNIFRRLRMVLERSIRRHGLKPSEVISPGLAEQILTNG